jgi:hypothetical protein
MKETTKAAHGAWTVVNFAPIRSIENNDFADTLVISFPRSHEITADLIPVGKRLILGRQAKFGVRAVRESRIRRWIRNEWSDRSASVRNRAQMQIAISGVTDTEPHLLIL